MPTSPPFAVPAVVSPAAAAAPDKASPRRRIALTRRVAVLLATASIAGCGGTPPPLPVLCGGAGRSPQDVRTVLEENPSAYDERLADRLKRLGCVRGASAGGLAGLGGTIACRARDAADALQPGSIALSEDELEQLRRAFHADAYNGASKIGDAFDRLIRETTPNDFSRPGMGPFSDLTTRLPYVSKIRGFADQFNSLSAQDAIEPGDLRSPGTSRLEGNAHRGYRRGQEHAVRAWNRLSESERRALREPHVGAHAGACFTDVANAEKDAFD